MLKRLLTLTFAVTLLAAACGDDDPGPATDDADDTDADDTDADDTDADLPTTGPATIEADDQTGDGEANGGEADLALATSGLGDIVVDSSGNTVYLFVPDAQGDSTCVDDCETFWPPVGELGSVGDGLDSTLLGMTTRTNGDVQATYNGWPLHNFSGDAAPGDTNGQGVATAWYVIGADGDAIGADS